MMDDAPVMTRARALPVVLALGVLAAALSVAARFPVLPWALVGWLLAAAAAVAWRPVWLFALVPAALPMPDLAPWSGWRLIDEFDLLLAVGVAVAWARGPAAEVARGRPLAAQPLRATLPLALLLTWLVVQALRALWPWPGLDAEALAAHPLGPFNALRVAKGALWAAVLWPLARALRREGSDPVRAFGTGLVIGLASATLAVWAERGAFAPHLFDMDGSYRVAGPFAAMALGGAYIECYLVVALPFLLVQLRPPLAPLRLLPGLALLLAACFALMVTFSRGGWLALAVVAALMLLAAMLAGRRPRQGPGAHADAAGMLPRLAAAGLLLALAASVVVPVLDGAHARSRLQTVAADLGTREAHWANSLRALDDLPGGLAWGAGLGRYAALLQLHGATPAAGGHRLLPQDGGVRLGAGPGYYLEQIVVLQPGQRYRLQLRARGPVEAMLCQKWLVASARCAQASATSRTAPSAEGWQTVALEWVAPSERSGLLPRPLRLTLRNPGRETVDISAVSLHAPDGREQLHNGRFTEGQDRWTFSSDEHLAWHAKSLPLGLLVELGLPGLLLAMAVFGQGLLGALAAARRGAPAGLALLAALLAFGTVGLTDTLLDEPRFLLLWLMLCAMPGLLVPPGAPRASSR